MFLSIIAKRNLKKKMLHLILLKLRNFDIQKALLRAKMAE